jgi:hypothetical protein
VTKIKLCSLGIICNTMLFVWEREMFLLSSISRDCTSVQGPCQVFVDRSVRFESSITHFLASDIQIHFIHLMCHTALMLLIFISFCALNSIVSYDQSKRVIEVGAFDRQWAFLWRAKIFIQSWLSFHFMFQNLLELSKINRWDAPTDWGVSWTALKPCST